MPEVKYRRFSWHIDHEGERYSLASCIYESGRCEINLYHHLAHSAGVVSLYEEVSRRLLMITTPQDALERFTRIMAHLRTPTEL